MRLINCTTRTPTLEDFAETDVPRFAILSHTWGKNEAIFTDIGRLGADGEGDDGWKEAPKYQKLLKSIKWALDNGYGYIWIDTCCIDKSSSAELQESINSMYRWYHDADICFAYLQDTPDREQFNTEKSRWFTRGWTLQELLAPSEVIFLGANWDKIGTRSSLAPRISALTGISQAFLEGEKSIYNASLAQRMSWAAGRQTTRTEDRAYSLLGIFNVNMPMLYGEGDKAYFRLQQEILKSTDDQSLLAWNGKASKFGVLAESPDQFDEHCRFLKKTSIIRRINSVSTEVSGKGLQINLICWRGGPSLPTSELDYLFDDSRVHNRMLWHAVLECSWTQEMTELHPVIAIEAGEAEDQYERIQPNMKLTVKGSAISEGTSFLRQTYDQSVFGK